MAPHGRTRAGATHPPTTEARRAATRRWYERNKERTRAARQQRSRERYAAKRASLLSARRERYATDYEFADDHAGHCANCGSSERIEADHRIPLYRGGSNEISNILPACRPCNRRKHRKTEEEFRALLQAERAAQLLGSG